MSTDRLSRRPSRAGPTDLHRRAERPAESSDAVGSRARRRPSTRLRQTPITCAWAITGFRVPILPWLAAPGWTLYLAGAARASRPARAILYRERRGRTIWPTMRRRPAISVAAACTARCSTGVVDEARAATPRDPHLFRRRFPLGQQPQHAAQGPEAALHRGDRDRPSAEGGRVVHLDWADRAPGVSASAMKAEVRPAWRRRSWRPRCGREAEPRVVGRVAQKATIASMAGGASQASMPARDKVPGRCPCSASAGRDASAGPGSAAASGAGRCACG